jgi:hypothetical protein
MEVKSILLIAVFLMFLWILINYLTRDLSKLTELSSAKVMQELSYSNLEPSGLNSSNFSYSIWFYIDDWNYRYGEPKVIFGRMMNGDTNKPCPAVTLGAMQNDVSVSLSLRSPTDKGQYKPFTCAVSNIPIQRWVNLMISVYGRTLDIYINGKLVRTCIMPGVAIVDSGASLYVTPNGGFSGWTSRFQYWSDASNPQKAWDVYRKGWGGSIYSNLFGGGSGGGYGVKVAFMEGDQEKGVLKI